MERNLRNKIHSKFIEILKNKNHSWIFDGEKEKRKVRFHTKIHISSFLKRDLRSFKKKKIEEEEEETEHKIKTRNEESVRWVVTVKSQCTFIQRRKCL